MPLVCLGLSHRTAPAEVRERHAFPDARASEALVALRDYEAVREASILSTCGRLEIYAEVIEPEAGVSQLKQFLTSFRHADIAYDIEPYLYAHHGRAAADQLLRVATGLDSMLIGEAEIICQVKSAYHIAQQAGSLGTTLHHLFAEAFTAAKAAHSRTSIGGASVSVATAAIGCAKEHVGTLNGKSVVLIGAGKMGQTAAKRLKVEGAVTLTVANRTHERAAELVTRLGTGRAVELESVDEVLATADVVIASTGAPTFVVTAAQVAHAMSLRPDRALCVIDIAVPRDVEPEVANIPGVRLVDIDELGATIDVTLERRRAAIPMVEEIIEVHLARFEAWNQLRATMPTIASLTQKAEAIRAAEVERLFARCPEIGPRERMLIAGMSMSVVSKLLHTPIAKIRQTAVSDRDEAFAQACAIAELFELRGDASAARESRRRALWNATAASAVSDD